MKLQRLDWSVNGLPLRTAWAQLAARSSLVSTNRVSDWPLFFCRLFFLLWSICRQCAHDRDLAAKWIRRLARHRQWATMSGIPSETERNDAFPLKKTSRTPVDSSFFLKNRNHWNFKFNWVKEWDSSQLGWGRGGVIVQGTGLSIFSESPVNSGFSTVNSKIIILISVSQLWVICFVVSLFSPPKANSWGPYRRFYQM